MCYGTESTGRTFEYLGKAQWTCSDILNFVGMHLSVSQAVYHHIRK